MSTRVKVSVDELSSTIEQELTIYSKSVTEGLKKQAKESMAQLVRDTKATAPVGKRKRHYKDSIRSRKESETERAVSYLWYVEGSNYRLSHLLENGHALRNGGRYAGTHFIANALEPIMEDYYKKCQEVCKNG
jgi:hypothetical protein